MAKINSDRLMDIAEFLAEQRPAFKPCACGSDMLRFEQREPPEGSGAIDYCVVSCGGCDRAYLIFLWDSDGMTVHAATKA